MSVTREREVAALITSDLCDAFTGEGEQPTYADMIDRVEALLNELVDDEREACAQVATDNKKRGLPTTDPWNVSADFIAAAIRARKES